MVSLRSPGVDPSRLLNVVGELSLVAGAPGLVGGQVVDLECEGKEVDLETLEYIHLHKTGALLKACVRTGAMIAGANEKLLKALTTYAEGIGLAFQIIDDILDLTSTYSYIHTLRALSAIYCLLNSKHHNILLNFSVF